MNPINEWQTVPPVGPSLRVLCAWCGGESARKADAPSPAAISHGICRRCAQQHFGIELPSTSDR